MNESANDKSDFSTGLDAIPSDIRDAIATKLDFIETEHDVRILFAVESGSRAWGFPSPNSDYDVRFVYLHRLEWYLSLDAGRDVIELPIQDDLDINGWDLRKALKLLIKPNPVLIEWLRSPIVYRADPDAMGRLAGLSERIAEEYSSSHHYLHLGRSTFRRYLAGKANVQIKKYFYALRPVLALLWLRTNPDRALPMDLPQIRNDIDLPDDVSRIVDDMLARKKVTNEFGVGPRVPELDDLIETELTIAEARLATPPDQQIDLLNDANALFVELVTGEV